MNILSISSDRKLFEYGSAVRSRLLEYGRLAEELHIIVFAKRSHGFKMETFPPNIFAYPTNSANRWMYIFDALRISKRIHTKYQISNTDWVVTTQDSFESGLVGYFIARALGARLHLQIHTDFMSPYFARESFLNRVRVHIAKFLLPRANAVRVVSERIKRSLEPIFLASHFRLSTFDFRLALVRVLPIFVGITVTHTSRDLKKNYPQFEKHILMASRLSPEKNIPLAIKAMKEVVEKYPKVGLIITGSGVEEARLKKLVKDLGLSKNVVFEGWQDDLASYYKTADLFLLTSNYEGYGMTIVEALSSGCPVVMTDVGCAGDVVQSGKNGLVVPVGDEKALTAAVCQVLSGEAHLEAKTPKLPTKEEYLASYRASWEDAFAK